MAAEAAPVAHDRFRWIERGVALASFGAAVAYIALRAASVQFYGGLGVTPEELGLGELDLLARSVGLLVVVVAVSATVAAVLAWIAVLLALLGIWDRVVMPLLNQLYRAPAWYQGVVLTAGAAALGVGLWRQNLLEFGPLLIFPLGGLLGYLWWRRSEPWPADLRSEARLQGRRLRSLFGAVWRPAMAAAAALSLVTAAAVVVITANAAAGAVRAGQAYRDPTLPWLAEPATVRWLTPPASDPLARRCLLYLGQANGTLVLYDAGSHSVVRAPAGQAVLLLDTEAARCRPD